MKENTKMWPEVGSETNLDACCQEKHECPLREKIWNVLRNPIQPTLYDLYPEMSQQYHGGKTCIRNIMKI